MQYENLREYIQLDEFFYQKDEIVNAHSSLWGEFNLSLNGILEYEIEQQRYLSPPHYGLWIPPQTAHTSIALDHHTTHYICIRIHPQFTTLFSDQTQTLSVHPFLRAVILELIEQQKHHAHPQHQTHLLSVFSVHDKNR